jgi:hypothetical protein
MQKSGQLRWGVTVGLSALALVNITDCSRWASDVARSVVDKSLMVTLNRLCVPLHGVHGESCDVASGTTSDIIECGYNFTTLDTKNLGTPYANSDSSQSSTSTTGSGASPAQPATTNSPGGYFVPPQLPSVLPAPVQSNTTSAPATPAQSPANSPSAGESTANTTTPKSSGVRGALHSFKQNLQNNLKQFQQNNSGGLLYAVPARLLGTSPVQSTNTPAPPPGSIPPAALGNTSVAQPGNGQMMIPPAYTNPSADPNQFSPPRYYTGPVPTIVYPPGYSPKGHGGHPYSML